MFTPQQQAKLAAYKGAVASGLFNEGQNTIVYRGAHITPEKHTFIVLMSGKGMRVTNLNVAKAWITQQLDGVGLREAVNQVKADGEW